MSGETTRSEIGTPQPPKLDLGSVKETVRREKHCLLLSGITATDAGIREIKDTFEKQYGGVERVKAFNSVINFKDPQNPNRFNQMADFIELHAKEGLDIVAHSFGAAELKKAIDIIKKRDSGFFDNKENTQNLRIILISPSGFSEGFLGPFRYLRRALKFAREQADFPIYSKSETLHRGIDALTAFPPEGVDPSVLDQALQEAMPELSQYREDGVKAISLGEQRDNINRLSQDQKDQIVLYSEMMRSAIDSGNYDGLRRLIASYGKILRSPLNAILIGNFNSVKTQALEATGGSIRAMTGGLIGLIKSRGLVFGALGSAPMKEFAKLQRNNRVSVDLIMPEYDMFMRLDQAITFFEGTGEMPQIVRRATHFFPVLQALGFGKMIGDLGETSTPIHPGGVVD